MLLCKISLWHILFIRVSRSFCFSTGTTFVLFFSQLWINKCNRLLMAQEQGHNSVLFWEFWEIQEIKLICLLAVTPDKRELWSNGHSTKNYVVSLPMHEQTHTHTHTMTANVKLTCVYFFIGVKTIFSQHLRCCLECNRQISLLNAGPKISSFILLRR